MDCVPGHGTTQGPSGWDRPVAALQDRGCRCAEIDLPTDRPELRAADYAALAAAQADVDHPVVVGHSGGCSSPRSASSRLFCPAAVYDARPTEPPAPSRFVLPAHHRALRRDRMARTARERLRVEPVVIDSGHCPHVSSPREVAEIMTQSA